MAKAVESDEQWKALMVLVDFFGEWCGPCKQIGPVFTRLAGEYPGSIFVKLDIDEFDELVEELGVTSLPTFMFFKAGKMVHKYAAKTDVGSDEPVAKKAKLEQAAVPGIRFEITEGSAGRTEEGAYFSMGGDTYKVPMSMHKANRDRICERMRKVGAAGLVLLKGGASTLRYDTDHEPVFRQESYFNWCFGVKEPDFLGAIEIATGKAVLFMPRLAQELAAWIGPIASPADIKGMYDVDEVLYADEVDAYCKRQGLELHVLYGQNSDSGNYAAPAKFDGIDAFKVDRDTLFQQIADARVFKSPVELELMRHVSKVTSYAHVEVMRYIKAGMPEFQLESLFRHHIYTHAGCRNQAYACICACGPNSAVLHYGHAGAPNDRTLHQSDMALLDMGAEYHCYCSDITNSYPVSGKFTADQKMIYTAVLMAVKAVVENMKPGTSWSAMHRLAIRTVVEHLIAGGVLIGDIDEVLAAGVGNNFLPCGLGHFIGCDTHDVGGYLKGNPARIDEGPHGIKKLRTARTLEAGMVLTVEPGCYFVPSLMDSLLKDPKKSPFVVKERLDQFRTFGGVRIEDVVAVTATGCENYTLTPRTVDEIEDVLAGGQWPPAVDRAPWLRRKWYATGVPAAAAPAPAPAKSAVDLLDL